MKKNLILLAVVVLVLGGLFYAFQKNNVGTGANSTTPAAATKNVELVVKNKKLVSGPQTIQVHEGDAVAITITSDVAEELHLHGYDKSVDLEKSVPATLSFTANLTGRFPYELEHSKKDIGVLEVLP